MVELGYYSLLGAVAISLYGVIIGSFGAVRREASWIRSAENSVTAVFALVTVSVVCLWALIFNDQFHVEYVARVSSTTIPLFYKITALWGGQAGSLLFWLAILATLSMIAVLTNRHRNRDMMPWTTVCLLGIMFFFSLLSCVNSNPFEPAQRILTEGIGLNPLLQNYWMAIHPPILYTGLTSVAIPFAFSLGALIAGKLDTTWIPVTRRWSLFSFVFLTLGFTLGGIWAYEELGWGGYWAWDPVENSSFMPWLAVTAFLHSVMITEKKGMLKAWNFVLILLAFELTIFGTFITRSGVIQSVHSFALSNIGNYFVVFLIVSTFFSLYWLSYRSKDLVSEGRLRSFLSREATFLLNNWLFLAIGFAVFWGTVFPMLSEWATGKKISVSAPFFNQVNWPLGLGLLVLTGICPLIAWRQASARNFRRNFLYPLVGGLVTGVVLLVLGVRGAVPLAFFSASGFVAATIAFEFIKGARARQAIRPSGFLMALYDLTMMNKRRYGGFIIHAGIVLTFIGIVASSFFQREEAFTLRAGESYSMAPYKLTFLGTERRNDPEKAADYAYLDGYRYDRFMGRFSPQIHRHVKQQQVVSEVAIRSTWRDDIYVVFVGADGQGNASFRVFINPLVNAIWMGIGIVVAGGLFVMTPNRGPRSRAAVKRRERSKPVEEAA